MVIFMNNNEHVDFPLEKFYSIEDNEDMLLRLTIGQSKDQFWVESDIVTSESKKIVLHLGLQQNLDSIFEATQFGLKLYHSHK